MKIQNKFVWTQYGQSITVKRFEHIAKLIEKKREEVLECLAHKLHADTFELGYKQYRRGKNRCLRYGLKLK